jgi:hypothetical protein
MSADAVIPVMFTTGTVAIVAAGVIVGGVTYVVGLAFPT